MRGADAGGALTTIAATASTVPVRIMDRASTAAGIAAGIAAITAAGAIAGKPRLSTSLAVDP
jgi:hypothetical protein